MTNTARGEVEIELGGEKLTFCATMGAIARVEGRLNKPMSLIADDLSQGSYRACLAIFEETCVTQGANFEDMLIGPGEAANAALEIFIAGQLLSKPGGKAKPGKK